MEIDNETHPSTQLHETNQRKTSQISRTQNRTKILQKSQKRKMGCTLGDEIQSQRLAILMKIKHLQGVETNRIFSHSLEDWGESLTISSLFSYN
jgi:hypothetical protein